MKWNKWLDKWTALPRGQRRATIVLLVVACVLCIAQLIASHYNHTRTTPNGNYTLLEEEIALFRSQLDTIPEEERPAVYIRRTHARKDSTYPIIKPKRKPRKPQVEVQPKQIEPVPRIGEETK